MLRVARSPGLFPALALASMVACGSGGPCGVQVISRANAPAEEAERLGEEMLRALHEKEYDRAREVLRSGADPGYMREGLNLLMSACIYDETTDIAISLVEHGADVTHEVDGFTALTLAAEQGNRCLVEYLLDHDADIDAGNGSSGTALLVALNGEKDEIAELLMDRGADVNAQNSVGVTALRLAVARPDAALIRDLVRRGADPRIVSSESSIMATPTVRLQALLRLREEAEAAPPMLREMSPALKQVMESPLSADEIRELVELLEKTEANLNAQDSGR